MLLRLEFNERKGDLEPALKVFHEAVDGENVYSTTLVQVLTHDFYRNPDIRITERSVLHHISSRKYDKCCKQF